MPDRWPGDLSRLEGRRVLVTGATGALGPAVVAALIAAGAEVHALVRRNVVVPGATATHLGELTDGARLAEAVAGMHGVVHLAALLHITAPPPELEAAYHRVNDEGTARLVEASLRSGVATFVHASTIAVYGPSAPGAPPWTEADPCRPDSIYARSKLAGEAHVSAARGRDGAPAGVVLRLGAVYGAGVKGNYRRLLNALEQGRYVHVGAGRNRRSLVHETDVAAAITLALSHPAARGQTFNVTDGQLHEMREIIAAMCAAMGRRTPRVRIPLPIARTMVGIVDLVARVAKRRSPVTPATLDKLLEDVAVSGERIAQVLGFTPQFGLESGWREVVARMQQEAPPSPAGLS
jgi:nucleoside-diphosphate-sugar epimerase